jgi:DNA-binding GntR family transcriptional regulator
MLSYRMDGYRTARLDKNLRERAYDRLRKRLFSGEYRPGEMISLSRLSELSEMPVAATREAVQWLEYDGMVRIFPKRGIQIAEVNVEFVRETFQLRMIFEKEGARRLAEIGRDQDFDALEAMTRDDMELVRSEVSDRTMKQIAKTNLAFHAHFIRVLNSREIERLHGVNLQRIAFINQNVNLPAGGEFIASMKEHLDIVSKLRARDPEAAAHAVETHLSSAVRRVMSL